MQATITAVFAKELLIALTQTLYELHCQLKAFPTQSNLPPALSFINITLNKYF